LIDDLWGDSPPESAANMLQGYVSHLRKTLGPGRGRGEHELLVSRAPGYTLQIRSDQLDAKRFERLATEGRRLLADRDANAAVERLRAALALWRGGALDDLAYEAFARADIERLEELRLQTLEDRIDADLAIGGHEALVPELRELVDRYPLRERLRAQLMAALYRCGRQAEALEAYREVRRVLLDDLGVEPGPALRELERAILRQDPALGAPAPPPAPIATRLGRRWPLLVGAAVLVGAALAAMLAFAHPGGAKAVAVKPHSVAVIDPAKNALVKDIAVGGYPGPLAADDGEAPRHRTGWPSGRTRIGRQRHRLGQRSGSQSRRANRRRHEARRRADPRHRISVEARRRRPSRVGNRPRLWRRAVGANALDEAGALANRSDVEPAGCEDSAAADADQSCA